MSVHETQLPHSALFDVWESAAWLGLSHTTAIHNFKDSQCHDAITIKAVSFHAYATFSVLLPFSKFFLEIVFLRVFSTTCNSASVTSIVSEWRPFSFIFNQENREKLEGAQSGK
jgi:hypothetical protein